MCLCIYWTLELGASVSVVAGKSKKMKDDLFAWDLGCWRSLLNFAQNLSRDWTKMEVVESICGGMREVSVIVTFTPASESPSLFPSTK